MQEQKQSSQNVTPQAVALQIVVCAGQTMMRPVNQQSNTTKFDIVSNALRLVAHQYRGYVNVLLATDKGTKAIQLSASNYDSEWPAKQNWTGNAVALPAFREAERNFAQQTIALITDSIPADMDAMTQAIGTLSKGVMLAVYIIGNDEEHRQAVAKWTALARTQPIKVTSLTGYDDPSLLAQNILSASF